MQLENSTSLIEVNQLKERVMGLVVSAQVIRELIADGEYLVECIEQRERGKIAVAFEMRSRMQPYSIQIETMDNKLGRLFHALSDAKSLRAEKAALVKVGSQPVPVIEVNSIPADVSTDRRGRKRKISDPTGSQAPESPKPTRRSRRSARQLVLVPQEATSKPTTMRTPSKRRRTARGMDRHENP
jgi:hypothetical protein